MVGSNGTMIAIRLVRSKLRKREDAGQHHHHQPNQVHPEQVQCPPISMMDNSSHGVVNPAMSSSTTTVDSCCNDKSAASTIVAAALETAAGATMVYTTSNGTTADQFVWQFPPPYPPPNTPPPQYTLYNDQDTLVHGLQTADRQQGFGKSFRKNLGGRWRRLVKRKPESEGCAIPPELKDQLKTIYVY